MRAAAGFPRPRFNRARNRWEVALVVGPKKYWRTGKTAKAVEQKMVKLKADLALGVQPSNETAGEYLTRWLEYMAPRVEASTYRGYASKVRTYLVPAFGKVRLERLGPREIDAMLTAMLKGNLSPATIGQARRIAHRAFQQALLWRLIPANPVTLTEAPRGARSERRTLSPLHAPAFLDHVVNDRLEALWTVAACLGLRQGELLGLRWEDVQEASLRVSGALKWTGAEYVRGTTKNRRERSVPLPTFVAEALARHRERQRFEARIEEYDNRLDLVFTREDGYPLNGPTVTHRFSVLLEEAGLPHIAFHDLRHCAVSLLLARGVGARTVMEVVGHASLDMTLSRYAHADDEGMRAAAAELDAWRAR